MKVSIRLIVAALPLPALLAALGALPTARAEAAGRAGPAAAEPAVAATIDTTLRTRGEEIRQFAFDGDPATCFASSGNPGRADHFTLLFDRAVEVKSVAVVTGRPEGGDRLEAGALEVSADGKEFAEVAGFTEGRARGEPKGRQVRAVRIRPRADLEHPLAIREISLESDPPVAVFRYPIEMVVDVSDAPEMKEWAENTARICERAYFMINEELKSDGFRPRHLITMRLRNDYQGVAATGGGRITGSVKFFKAHPDDVGAMVHETIHNVQAYPRGVPSWLTEGICDYIRFFKFEPGKLRPPSRDRARHNASYKVTAQFLAFVCEKYDRDFVRKLNALLRRRPYQEEVFKELTGKTVQDLAEEWRATLPRRRRV